MTRNESTIYTVKPTDDGTHKSQHRLWSVSHTHIIHPPVVPPAPSFAAPPYAAVWCGRSEVRPAAPPYGCPGMTARRTRRRPGLPGGHDSRRRSPPVPWTQPTTGGQGVSGRVVAAATVRRKRCVEETRTTHCPTPSAGRRQEKEIQQVRHTNEATPDTDHIR